MYICSYRHRSPKESIFYARVNAKSIQAEEKRGMGRGRLGHKSEIYLDIPPTSQ